MSDPYERGQRIMRPAILKMITARKNGASPETVAVLEALFQDIMRLELPLQPPERPSPEENERRAQDIEFAESEPDDMPLPFRSSGQEIGGNDCCAE